MSGSSIDIQSLGAKEVTENKNDSNPVEKEESTDLGSINLDQTIGMDVALQKTLQEK